MVSIASPVTEGGCQRAYVRAYGGVEGFEPYAALLWFVVAVRLISNAYYDLYRLRGEFSYLDECVRVFSAAVGRLAAHRGGGLPLSRRVRVPRLLLRARRLRSRLLPRARGLRASCVLRRAPRRAPSAGARSISSRRSSSDAARRPRCACARCASGASWATASSAWSRRARVPLDEEFEGVPVVAHVSGLTEAIRETGANEVIITDPTLSGDMLFDVMMRVGRARRRVPHRAESLQLPAAQDRD